MKKSLPFILVLLLSAVANCEDPANSASQNATPTTITADRMEMLIGQIAKLEGHVIVTDEKMTLTSDKMLIFMAKKEDGAEKETPTEENGGMNIDRIEATGNVMIHTHDGSKSATGDRGLFNKAEDKLTLEGNCTIISDGSIMKCPRVVYDRKNDIITSGRATIIIPSSEKKSKDGHDDDKDVKKKSGSFDSLLGLPEKKKK